MAGKAQSLIERAMSTDNEHEMLACLRQAKKHWKGTPDSSDSGSSQRVSVSEYNTAVRAYKDAKKTLDKALNDNKSLRRQLHNSARTGVKETSKSSAKYQMAIVNLKQQVDQERASKTLRTWFLLSIIVLLLMV